MSQSTSTRGVLALLTGLLVTAGLLTTTTAPADAGQVGVTIGIQGAGAVTVVEGSLEDGAATTCTKYYNQDHRVTVWCERFRNTEAFEAWVWLRPTPLPSAAGEWRFEGWSGCDSSRVRDGVVECAVHSGAFSSDERQPVAHFRDVIAPTVSELSLTQVPDVDRQFRLTFAVSDGRTDCRVEGVTDWVRCVSGHPATAPEGIRRFQVRGTDASGNTTVAHVDAPVVDTTIVSGPSPYTRNRTASFALRSAAGKTFWCSCDFRAWTDCGGGPDTSMIYLGVDDGVHSLRVQARTGAWIDPVPAEWRWTVDTVAPTTRLTASTAGTAATFTFASDDARSFQCKLDSPGETGTWQWCSSPIAPTALGQGAHTFTVRSYDAAGNEETAPPAHHWVVDTVAPTTSLVASTSGDNATFAFAAAGAVRFECRLARPSGPGQWARCTSPTTYIGLVPGQHRFEVRATDAAGNIESAPVAHTWTATAAPKDPEPTPQPDPTPPPTLDTTAPDTTFTSGPSGFVLSPGATFGLGSEPGATFMCTLDGAAVPCGTTVTLSGLRSGTHTLTAAAVDAVGNVDASPAVRTWTVPGTSRELRIAKGWKLRQTSAAYGSSRLEATRRGSVLSRKVTGARSVALVVGKGRRHGTVALYAGSRLLSTVRLSAPRTASQVLVPVATFTAPYTGSLRVVVTTQGRPVRIEGLGVATG
jgi:hypothetical protein